MQTRPMPCDISNLEDIGHSVRNQIATIQSYGELLRDEILGPLAGGEQLQALKVMLRSIDQVDLQMDYLFQAIDKPSFARAPQSSAQSLSSNS